MSPASHPGTADTKASGASIDFEAALRDPTRFYSGPCDVLEDQRLDREQKRRLLESWALDARLLSEAEAENMPGRATERPFLREARLALLELDR